MRGLERAVECLKPLVDSKDWDYCVVWKLGDDPSRFLTSITHLASFLPICDLIFVLFVFFHCWMLL